MEINRKHNYNLCVIFSEILTITNLTTVRYFEVILDRFNKARMFHFA
jgi:hypothetical protein